MSAGAAGLLAQSKGQYRARLSTVPIDVAMQAHDRRFGLGHGHARRHAPRRQRHLRGVEVRRNRRPHSRRPTRIPGPPVFDLAVSGGTSGSINGTLTLTAAQAENLSKGRYYVQLHSEKAPDGNLRGWLLPSENRR